MAPFPHDEAEAVFGSRFLPLLHGTLDEVLGYQRRYTRTSLQEALTKAGFTVEAMFDFNRAATLPWWFNGKVLRRRHFGRLQLKILNMTVWLLRPLDKQLPWGRHVVGRGGAQEPRSGSARQQAGLLYPAFLDERRPLRRQYSYR